MIQWSDSWQVLQVLTAGKRALTTVGPLGTPEKFKTSEAEDSSLNGTLQQQQELFATAGTPATSVEKTGPGAMHRRKLERQRTLDSVQTSEDEGITTVAPETSRNLSNISRDDSSHKVPTLC